MARAKMTKRAEARRHYRAQLAAEAATTGVDEADGTNETGGSRTEPAVAGGTVRRVIAGIHPPDFRTDVRSIPEIVRAKPWILVPYGLVLVGAIIAGALPKGESGGSIASIYVQLAFLQPTLLYFAVGFLVPRGAYLFGALLGILGSVLFLVLTLGLIGMFRSLDTMSVTDRLLYSGWQFLQFTLTGAIFGWFAAWYRDWLRRSQERSRAQAEARKRDQRRQQRRSETKRA